MYLLLRIVDETSKKETGLPPGFKEQDLVGLLALFPAKSSFNLSLHATGAWIANHTVSC